MTDTPEANRIATIVANRCHGDRKPGSAPQRYAVIWQAARLGAIEAMKERPKRRSILSRLFGEK